ncbi:MAG: GDSL-like Lipase/Acylhydrolase [Lacunisphaera sp.]|nr:GDSL-like Lipase/Acylhydrolase [Lacunisphaera sp.]
MRSPIPPASLRRLLVLSLTLALLPGARAKPAVWAAEIDQLAQADKAHPPASHGIVFVGSSSIKFWSTLAKDFPGRPVYNHGFGGSELADSVFYEDQLVLAHHPDMVVLYAGENDLAAGKSPETVLADFRAFRAKLHAALPATRLLFLAIKESPSRARIREQVLKANAFIAADCATDKRCLFVDVATPLLDAAGRTRPELFRDDQLHLQPAGYAIWTKVVAPLLTP